MRVRWRRLVGMALVAGAALPLWGCVPIARVELDEAGIPTNRQAHLPRDVVVVEEDESCGSGGCWRALTLSWSGHPGAALAQRLGLQDDPSTEFCRPVSLLDRRRACLGVGSVAGASGDPGLLRVQLHWRRPLGL